MTLAETKTATYEELTERLDELLAHPETHWRVTAEVRLVELELYERDMQHVYDKVDLEIMLAQPGDLLYPV